MLAIPAALKYAAPVVGLSAVLAWRIRETRTPVSARKIILPPLGMATGFSMFLFPAFRVPWSWALGALVLGATVFAYPLLATSRLVWKDGSIMARRSSAFLAVTVLLAVIRYLARGYLDTFLSASQTAALFYLVAFGMILRWRVSMLAQYRALRG